MIHLYAASGSPIQFAEVQNHNDSLHVTPFKEMTHSNAAIGGERGH